MNKFIYALLLIGIYSCFVWVAPVQAEGYKPLITGNYEQGQRIYDTETGERDYFFREGWIKWKQKLSTTNYYYFKIRIAESDYQRTSYNHSTLNLTGNYTYQLFDPLRLKLEVQLQDKNHQVNLEKDYLEVGTSLEVSYRPGKKDHLLWNLSYQQENYDLSDKSNGMTGMALRWERKVWSGFRIHSRYKHTLINYFNENSLADKQRRSISIGFEYQL